MTVKTPRDNERVRKRVNELLNDRQGQSPLEVQEDGIYEQDDWLYVIVVPRQAEVRATEFVDRLSDVEAQIRKEFDQHILLVPARAV